PLQHGVAAHDALLVAAFVGAPAMVRGMFPLADGGRARVERHPLVDVRVLRLGALGIRFPVSLFADRAEVVEEHWEQVSQVESRTITVGGLRTRVLVEEGRGA